MVVTFSMGKVGMPIIWFEVIMQQNPCEKSQEILSFKQERTSFFVMTKQGKGIIGKNLEPIKFTVYTASRLVSQQKSTLCEIFYDALHSGVWFLCQIIHNINHSAIR